MKGLSITPKQAALSIAALGTALVVAGVALIYPPAAFIVGGGGLVAFALIGIDVDR